MVVLDYLIVQSSWFTVSLLVLHPIFFLNVWKSLCSRYSGNRCVR